MKNLRKETSLKNRKAKLLPKNSKPTNILTRRASKALIKEREVHSVNNLSKDKKLPHKKQEKFIQNKQAGKANFNKKIKKITKTTNTIQKILSKRDKPNKSQKISEALLLPLIPSDKSTEHIKSKINDKLSLRNKEQLEQKNDLTTSKNIPIKSNLKKTTKNTPQNKIQEQQKKSSISEKEKKSEEKRHSNKKKEQKVIVSKKKIPAKIDSAKNRAGKKISKSKKEVNLTKKDIKEKGQNKNEIKDKLLLPLIEASAVKNISLPSIESKNFDKISLEVKKLQDETFKITTQVGSLIGKVNTIFPLLNKSTNDILKPVNDFPNKLKEEIRDIRDQLNSHEEEIIYRMGRLENEIRETKPQLSSLSNNLNQLIKTSNSEDQATIKKKIEKISPKKPETAQIQKKIKAQKFKEENLVQEEEKLSKASATQKNQKVKKSSPNKEASELLEKAITKEDQLSKKDLKEKSSQVKIPVSESHATEKEETGYPKIEGKSKSSEKSPLPQGKSPLVSKNTQIKTATPIKSFNTAEEQKNASLQNSASKLQNLPEGDKEKIITNEIARDNEIFPKSSEDMKKEVLKTNLPISENKEIFKDFPFDNKKQMIVPTPKLSLESDKGDKLFPSDKPLQNKDIIVNFNARLQSPSELKKSDDPFSYKNLGIKSLDKETEEKKTLNNLEKVSTDPFNFFGEENKKTTPEITVQPASQHTLPSQPVKVFFDKTEETLPTKTENFLASSLDQSLKATEKKNFFS